MPRSASTLVDGHHVTTLIRTWELGLVGWVGGKTRLFLVSSLAGWLPHHQQKGGQQVPKKISTSAQKIPKNEKRARSSSSLTGPVLASCETHGSLTWRAVCAWISFAPFRVAPREVALSSSSTPPPPGARAERPPPVVQ